jgi:hypothetical protein
VFGFRRLQSFSIPAFTGSRFALQAFLSLRSPSVWLQKAAIREHSCFHRAKVCFTGFLIHAVPEFIFRRQAFLSSQFPILSLEGSNPAFTGLRFALQAFPNLTGPLLGFSRQQYVSIPAFTGSRFALQAFLSSQGPSLASVNSNHRHHSCLYIAKVWLYRLSYPHRARVWLP